jgi:hypothetical protein
MALCICIIKQLQRDDQAAYLNRWIIVRITTDLQSLEALLALLCVKIWQYSCGTDCESIQYQIVR